VEKTLATRMLDKGKRIAITLALLNQPYKSMQSKIDIIKNGVSVTQKAFTDGIEIAGKSNKVMKKYEKERKTYPARIVKAGEDICDLLCNSQGAISREDIKSGGIKVQSNDWKILEDYLEDNGIEWVQPPGVRGGPRRLYKYAIN
jgi:aspartyl/asparaginyl-tRNA synthetase